MTAPLKSLPEDVGEPLPIIPRPEEPFEPLPVYRRPLERNVIVGPMSVSTCLCPECGELFAYGIPLVDGRTVLQSLPEDLHPRCPRCEYGDRTVPPELAQRMAHVRWKLNEWKAAIAVGSGAPQAEQRSTGLAASQAFWIHGPAMLAALEEVYGDQVTVQTHAIAHG